MISPLQVVGLAAVLGLVAHRLLARRELVDKNGHPLPPGPYWRQLPMGDYIELVFDRWAKTYGPIFSVYFGDQLFVVLSDPVVAHDLLVENGAIFSSRKDYFVKNTVILHDRALTANPYDQRWRTHRRLAMKFLNEKNAATMDFQPEVIELLRSLHQESASCSAPVNPALPAVRFTLNNMLGLSFATRTSSLDDPFLHTVQKLVMEFDELTGCASNAIDIFKPLQWFPNKTKSRGLAVNEEINKVYGELVSAFQARLDSGEDVPDCVMKHLLTCGKEEGLEYEDILMIGVAFAFGGVHSIAGILQWFLAFMATHPDIAKRAREELDAVVGRDRMPDNEDEKSLPYIRAIIKEVERIHAPFWIPTPHYSTADFVYNGMFIPKGTVMVLNNWTIHHNEARYPDAFTFNPDRYLGDETSSIASARLRDPMQRDHWTFGAGRRICPGFAVAERELWLAVSGLLWTFNFEAIADEPISLAEYEGESGRTPLPFRMGLSLRDDAAAKMLETGTGFF